MVMGLVSGLSLANHSDSEFFLVVHALFSQDGCQQEGFWEVVGQVVSPFDLSGTLQARILEWVAVPFSRVSSQSRDRTQVSRITGGFFTS